MNKKSDGIVDISLGHIIATGFVGIVVVTQTMEVIKRYPVHAFVYKKSYMWLRVATNCGKL